MARARDPNRDKAFEMYKKHNGNITNRKIGETLGVPEKTISAWKCRDKWTECSTTEECSTTKRKRGGQPGNKNATGPPLRNRNAVKHGISAKYLPDAVYDILEEIENKAPIDILWENITLTYANLLHAQRILFVKDKEDTTEFIAASGEASTSYEIHAAWDKQSRGLQAIAKAQTELRNMIKTYDELTRSELVTEEQRLRIDRLRAELGSDEMDDTVITGFKFDRSEYNGDTQPS